ncbi:MAG: 2-oxo acid dehydrogenase subunit E2 [Oscillospiraceae bacterium]|jgi:pyruvate dehydrogenase E2 component (dihydrolipoamide acetyltransferase)|nr:2-oxo acid dehydrogenase subunit E2 [Oscillospiraceae bacterium]
MAQLVLLPQLGIADESAVVSSFRVKKGDTVSVGAPLFAIETGKSVFEVASEFEGAVLALLCDEGDELPIKAPVIAIGQPGEEYGSPPVPTAGNVSPSSDDGEVGPPHLSSAGGAPPCVGEPPLSPAGDISQCGDDERVGAVGGHSRVLASPRARALADKAGVDASYASATGPEGLIIERDIRKLLDSGIRTPSPIDGKKPATAANSLEGAAAVPSSHIAPLGGDAAAAAEGVPPPDYTDAPMSTMRKVIAKNMAASLTSAAQLTHSSSFDAAEIFAYRARCKADAKMSGVTLGDMVLFAVSRTLMDFPGMNAHVLGETIRRFSGVHLAVAIDIPGGLVVPVIRDAHRKSLLDISNETKLLAKQSREGTLPPDKLTGGTFTVSNLGSLGVEHFTPIINPPQAGILGVNNSTLRPRRKADGSIEFYDALSLSLTYDHRAVDGAPASRFLKAVCDNLAAFTLLLGR